MAARRAAIKGATNAQGQVVDYYTGEVLDPKVVQVDHVYPAERAWFALCLLPRDQRIAFANDPLNLVATSAHLNESKGAQLPGEWLHTVLAVSVDQSHACAYGLLIRGVAGKWRLPLSPADEQSIDRACKVG